MDPCPGVSSCTHCRAPSQCFLGDRIYPSRILVPTKQLLKLTQKLRHSQRSQHRKSPAGCLLKYWHPQRMMTVTTCTIKNMDGASFSKLLLVNMTLWFCIFVYSAILLSSLSAGFLGYFMQTDYVYNPKTTTMQVFLSFLPNSSTHCFFVLVLLYWLETLVH